MAATQITAINTAYSVAVGPSSDRRSRRMTCLIAFITLAPYLTPSCCSAFSASRISFRVEYDRPASKRISRRGKFLVSDLKLWAGAFRVRPEKAAATAYSEKRTILQASP
jgi:hypothetical protein